MANLTQDPTQIQTNHNAIEASNVGLDSITDGSDTQSTAAKKSGVHALQASSTDAPTTERAVMLTMARDEDAISQLRHGQIVLTEGGNLYWSEDNNGTLGTWQRVVSETATQTLTNKTLTGAALNGTLGATTPAAASVTTLDASGDVDFASGLAIQNFSTTGADKGLTTNTVTNQVTLRSSAITTAAANLYEFYNPNGNVGNIRTTASATQFNTSSDPRLKSEFEAIDDELAATMVIDAVENKWVGVFTFKADPKTPIAGYNAHALVDNQPTYGGAEGEGPRDLEIGAIYQEAEHDEGGEEVLPELRVSPAGVDQSKRVPLLEAALYNALKRIEALEA